MTTTIVIETAAQLKELHYVKLAPGTVVSIRKTVDISDHDGYLTLYANGSVINPVRIEARNGAKIIGKSLSIVGQGAEVDGLHIAGGRWGSLRIESVDGVGPDRTHDILIRKCTFEDGGAGVWIEKADGVEIERCHFENLQMIVNDTESKDNDFGAIVLKATRSTDIVMRFCTINDAIANSHDYRADGAGLEVFQDVSNVTLEYNLFYDTMTPVEIGGYEQNDTAKNIVFRNNVVHLDPEYADTPSARPLTIHGDLNEGQYGINIEGVVFENNLLLNYVKGRYVSGESKLSDDQLRIAGNVERDEPDITYAQFIEQYTHVLAGNPPLADAPETPEPPTSTPNPPSAYQEVKLRIQATLDGKEINMPDRVASLLLPQGEVLSKREQMMLELFRSMSDTQQRAWLTTITAML